MLTARSSVGYNLYGLHIKPYSRSQILSWNSISRNLLSNHKDKYCFSGKNTRARYNNKIRRNFVVYADHNSAAGDSVPSGSSSNSIKRWILGMVSLVLPFFTNKWGPLWVLKNRIENAVETVEEIVETVEKVAEEVDKIAENISDDLPEGKMKDLVELVENVAEKTAKSADSLDDLIDKVQEAEDQMESFVESLDEEAKKSSKEAKDYK